MQFLADENIPPLVVHLLRDAGLEVEAISETMPGAKDGEILSRSDISDFVLITFDSDFGDLIFNQKQPQPLSILYIRLNRAAPRNVVNRIMALIKTGVPEGCMVVLTKDEQRIRSFPLGAINV